MEHPYSIACGSESVSCLRLSRELDRELAECGMVDPPRRPESSKPDHTIVAGNDLVTGKEQLAGLHPEAGEVTHGSVFNHKRTGSFCIGAAGKQKRTTAQGR